MQNERKGEFMKNKKYVVPELSVVNLETKDIMVFSVIFGSDTLDNWAEDPF